MPLSPELVTQAEFARIIDAKRQTVGKMIKRRIINGTALIGAGRDLRIDVEKAKRQINARRDVGQALGNGAKTRLTPGRAVARQPDPAPADDQDADDLGTGIDEAIKREKLIEIQGRNRKTAEDEAARSGRYVLASSARAQARLAAAELLRIFEGALPELAGDVAARHQSEGREELLALRQVFARYRARMAETAKKTAEALPALVDEPSPAPSED